jgi:DNA-binding transcriptional LysR family regulator
MKMHLDDIHTFVRVVQAGSFTAGARHLGLTKSTVSARVTALEAHLGVALLRRTTRAMSLTPEGAAYFEECAQAVARLEAAEGAAAGGQAVPKGVLRVSAPSAYGEMVLPRFLAGFATRYPQVSVRVNVTDRLVDLVREGVDVAIRSGVLADSTLVVRKLTDSDFRAYASAKYLKRAGTPKTPAALARHATLGFLMFQDTWTLERSGRKESVRLAPRVATDDLATLAELAAEGLGIALLPDFVAARRGLAPVLPGWRAHATGIYVVYPPDRVLPLRTRLFIDELLTSSGR